MGSSDLASYFETLEHNLSSAPAARFNQLRALEKLLNGSDSSLKFHSDLHRADAGAPDLIGFRGQTPVAYVTTLDFNSPPQGAENSQHVRQLRAALPNFLLTNFVEFRWYVMGELRRAVHVAELRSGRLVRSREADVLPGFLNEFIHTAVPMIHTAPELARRLGEMSRLIRTIIANTLTGDAPDRDLSAQMNTLRQLLLPELTVEQFADDYAQMLTSCLFAARARHTGTARRQPFTRRDVYWNLPPTNPFMKSLFQQIEGANLDSRIAWLVDAQADLLAHSDVESILADFRRVRRQDDPVNQFYATFLQHHDPALKTLRGVHYTPEAVASFVVRSVDRSLRKRFKRALGLADEKVAILDPAAGTGTFLYLAIQLIYDALRQQRQLGVWNDYVRDCLLPRLYGCEIALSRYAVAHMKLAIQLAGTGYTFHSNQRLGMYLTDTFLDSPPAARDSFGRLVAEEIAAAGVLKRQQKPMLVMGAPPLDSIDGESESSFLRFLDQAYRIIQESGCGIIAFVSDNHYLAHPDFQALRQRLLLYFDDTYVLNLRGGGDEGIMDTPQDTVVSLFTRRPRQLPSTSTPSTLEAERFERRSNRSARVHYLDLWGTRREKQQWLFEHDVFNAGWQEFKPRSPEFFFIPQDIDLLTEYEQCWALDDIFAFISTDDLVETETQKPAFSPEDARQIARSEHLPDSVVTPILYRPFDLRYRVEAGQFSASQNRMNDGNLGLIFAGQVSEGGPYTYFGVCQSAVDARIFTAEPGRLRVAPLYIHPGMKNYTARSPFAPGYGGRQPNLNAEFILEMAGRLDMRFVPEGHGKLKGDLGPEDLLDYIYAIFHSRSYRTRYGELLAGGVPRIPLTSSIKLFHSMAKKGRRLVNLHLMRAAESWPLVTGFTGGGSSELRPDFPRMIELAGERGGRVYLNDDKYFEGVEREIWNFNIGGYPVLRSWLDERQGRILEWPEIRYFQQVVVALRGTIRLMNQINDAIPSWPVI